MGRIVAARYDNPDPRLNYRSVDDRLFPRGVFRGQKRDGGGGEKKMRSLGRRTLCLSIWPLQKGLAAVGRGGNSRRPSQTRVDDSFLSGLSLPAGRDDDVVLYGSIQGRNDPPRASAAVVFSGCSAGVGAPSQGRVFARRRERERERERERRKEEEAVKYFEPRKASRAFRAFPNF